MDLKRKADLIRKHCVTGLVLLQQGDLFYDNEGNVGYTESEVEEIEKLLGDKLLIVFKASDIILKPSNSIKIRIKKD